MKIGYARVSKKIGQRLHLQERALKEAGCKKIFADQISGRASSRPALHRAYESLRPGDILVIWKVDRLGRDLLHLLTFAEKLKRKKVSLISLTEGFDLRTPSGRLLYQICGAQAEYECSMIGERTTAGLSAARLRGSKLGRKHAMSERQFRKAVRLSQHMSLNDVAAVMKIGRSTLYREFQVRT